MPIASAASRRNFLRFVASSPLVALRGAENGKTIESPEQALNVMDFEAAARKALPPAHFGYLTTGVDDDVTVQANHTAFRRYQLRPRRLMDVSKVDPSVELFGTRWPTPLFLCPCGSQRAYHPEGEVASARASATRNTLQMLSTVSTYGIEDVMKAATRPVWYQLYPTSSDSIAERMVKRAEAAGCPVLVITVDIPAGRNTETQKRFTALDTRTCNSCHTVRKLGARRPMFDGLDTTGTTIYNAAFTWASVRRLRSITKMRIVLKGIAEGEDARIAVEEGIDGLVVSNHGGRSEDSGRATIDCLAEVVDSVRGRMPVLLDGGVRRGTDVFKALALGARAVGIGRPYLWGLGAFGQAGVEAVLDILNKELHLAMAQCGTRSVAEIRRSHVVAPPVA